MRFSDLLRVTVLISAAAATLLATLVLITLAREDNPTLAYVSVGWWMSAVIFGLWLGRDAAASPPIAGLLRDARHQTMLPELRPAATLLNRLWPLLLSTFAAGAVAVVLAQVASVAAGFAIIWALAWRKQDAAVAAIEERDGVRFYVDKTSPLQAIRLIRTPGFTRE